MNRIELKEYPSQKPPIIIKLKKSSSKNDSITRVPNLNISFSAGQKIHIPSKHTISRPPLVLKRKDFEKNIANSSNASFIDMLIQNTSQTSTLVQNRSRQPYESNSFKDKFCISSQSPLTSKPAALRNNLPVKARQNHNIYDKSRV